MALPDYFGTQHRTRIAQDADAPYDAFSTLQPVYVRPSVASSAAPTRKSEYLQYANSLAAGAARARIRISRQIYQYEKGSCLTLEGGLDQAVPVGYGERPC